MAFWSLGYYLAAHREKESLPVDSRWGYRAPTMFHAAVYHLWNPQWKSSLEWMKFNHLIRKFCFCQVWLWPNIVTWAFQNMVLMELVTDGTCWIIYIWAGTISSDVETHCLLVFSHFNKNWDASQITITKGSKKSWSKCKAFEECKILQICILKGKWLTSSWV